MYDDWKNHWGKVPSTVAEERGHAKLAAFLLEKEVRTPPRHWWHCPRCSCAHIDRHRTVKRVGLESRYLLCCYWLQADLAHPRSARPQPRHFKARGQESMRPRFDRQMGYGRRAEGRDARSTVQKWMHPCHGHALTCGAHLRRQTVPQAILCAGQQDGMDGAFSGV